MSNKEQSFWSKLSHKLTRAKAIENEEDVMTDHEYDGIRELDNVLPPWWLAGFYITIGIGIFYYIMAFTTDKYNQELEFNNDMAESKAAVEKYKKDHPELYDASNLEALTDAVSIKKGRGVFVANKCKACHLDDGGGGIGPNLTDKHWILGGGFKNIMNTLAKGGRPGKGMIAWESTISLEGRQQLASYILTLQGTTPANPKPPQGDVWTEGDK